MSFSGQSRSVSHSAMDSSTDSDIEESHVTQTELDVSNFRSVLFDNLFLYWTDLLDFFSYGEYIVRK